MNEAKNKLVKSWLAKAHRDLSAAEKLSEGKEPGTDIQPDPQTFSEALKDARLLFDFILSRLPEEVHP